MSDRPTIEDGHSRSVAWALVASKALNLAWRMILVGIGAALLWADHGIWGGILIIVGLFA